MEAVYERKSFAFFHSSDHFSSWFRSGKIRRESTRAIRPRGKENEDGTAGRLDPRISDLWHWRGTIIP